MTFEENSFTRTSATTDDLIPNLYDERAEKYLYDKDVLRQLCIDKSGMILGKAGNSFNVYKETEFSVSELTETVDTPISELDFDKVQLTINWYGGAVKMTKESLSESFSFVLDDLQFGASGAMGENRNYVIMSEFLNTSTSALYPYDDSGDKYTSSTIESTAVLQEKQVVDAQVELLKKNRTLRYLIIHPKQFGDLSKDTALGDNTKYPQNVRLRGELPVLRGAQIIVHNSVQSTTENSVTVYQAIALADRATIYAQKVSPVMEFDEEYKRQRGLVFHFYEAFGAKNLNDDAIYILKSA